LVSLGVAAGFGVDGRMAAGSLDELCGGQLSPCKGHTAADIDPFNARMDRGLGMFIGFGAVGVAGVVVGAVGLATRGRGQSKAADALVVTPVVEPGVFAAAVGGRF
ncbi:MAG: hypothetical protein ABI193_18655, partial [Minicystis sp.]